jgi:16S rRNA (adenine1518-N6/adenine1519-N6)-dimethyltransferase
MELSSVSTIKDILKINEARPLKQFGQHFLIDKSVLKKIVEASNISSRDIILEIGPGIGVLTQELAKRAEKVIAVEKDNKMVEILKEVLVNHKNVEIIQGDILKFPISNFQFPINKMVANLPYYIVSPVIRKFLEEKNKPEEMTLMVQKEVAQRICAKPPDMNLLAVSVQFYSKPKIISYVSKNSFWPRPKVDSAIIKITVNPVRKNKTLSPSPRQGAGLSNGVNSKQRTENRDLFFKIVKAGFSQPRKQLCNNLKNGLKLNKTEIKVWLLKNRVDPTQRAETLTIEDWKNLLRSF